MELLFCWYPSCRLECSCPVRGDVVRELWEPVDPYKVGIEFLRDRMFIFMNSSAEPAPDVPIPPGKFLCMLCRRLGNTADFELTQEECRRRFGEVPLEDQYNICDDCNKIISADLGIPLLCALTIWLDHSRYARYWAYPHRDYGSLGNRARFLIQ